MKKNLFLFLLMMPLLIFSQMTNAQSFTLFEAEKVNGNIIVEGMSSDGKYVVGLVSYSKIVSFFGESLSLPVSYMFTWTKEDGIDESDYDNIVMSEDRGQGSAARSISNTGRIAGISANPEYTEMKDIYVLDDDGNIIDFDVAALPIRTAAYKQYGSQDWTHFQVASELELRFDFEGHYAYDITDDGSILVGGLTPGRAADRRIAAYWKVDGNNTDVVQLMDDVIGSAGSRIYSVSGDGTVMGGHIALGEQSTIALPAIWINDELHEIENINSDGAVLGISNNGLYATLITDNRAAFYNIEKGTYEFLENENNASTGKAVSNNGIVVGHWGTETSPTSAFIYKKSIGMMRLADFLDENGIQYTQGFNFRTITSISADGRIISGHGTLGGEQFGFYVEIPEIEDGLFPVDNIGVENIKFGIIQVSWEEPEEKNPNITLTGYNIYCNGEKIHTAGADETVYNHNVSENGTYEYYIKAVYDGDESRESKTVGVTMGRRDLPFREAFPYPADPNGEYETLSKVGFWDVTTNSVLIKDSWRTQDAGNSTNDNAAIFRVPLTGEYEESMTSPFLDATNAEDLYLNFSIYITNSTTEAHNIGIDVYNGDQWSTVDNINGLSSNSGWYPQRYDLTDIAAGNSDIRVRFRAYGNGDGLGTNWFIDDIHVESGADTIKILSPIVAQAVEDKTNGNVIVTWVGGDNTANLTYTPTEVWSATMIGNEGKSFIAANMFTAEDMEIYDGFKLTHLSFMPGRNPELSGEPAKYKWFVSQGAERLCSEDINAEFTISTDTMKFYTGKLQTPITIDGSKPLYYGVEVVSHEANDMPVATSDLYEWTQIGADRLRISVDAVDGRGNLISEDGGATWENIPFDVDAEYGIPVYQIVNVKATLSKDESTERIPYIKGYRVLRNGEHLIMKITNSDAATLVNGTSVVDFAPVQGEEACYEIITFYQFQRYSDSMETCITLTGIELYEKDNSGISVYPNRVSNGQTIYIELDNESIYTGAVKIYNVAGTLVKEVKVTDRLTPVSIDFPNGIYILTVKDKTLKILVD